LAPPRSAMNLPAMRMRNACALLLLACVVAAPSCALYYGTGKFLGLISPPPFDVNMQLPDDFQLSLDVKAVADPPTDYVLTFDRSGRASYDVTVRTPRRKQQAGQFEITEEQIKTLWKTVAAAKFDTLEPNYPDKGEGPDKNRGVQKYYVYAAMTEHRVEARFQANESLEAIRKVAVSMAPPGALKAADVNTALPGDAPKEFVGDMASHQFHLPDCTKLKDVPPANRQAFATQWDAVNFNLKPCPECQPMKTR
jgi:hypothetical protein